MSPAATHENGLPGSAQGAAAPASQALLQVRDLKVHPPLGGGLFGTKAVVKAVDGVSFDIPRGTTFGIVGESGSGKSATALAVMRLVKITAGSVRLDVDEIGSLEGEALRKVRKRFQMVFQDPFASLNPRKRASDAIQEALELMEVGEPSQRVEVARTLFLQTGLRPEQLLLFPHQFLGGQRQRIVLARALAANPELLVCDEPVSALDVAIQAQIFILMQRLQRDRGLNLSVHLARPWRHSPHVRRYRRDVSGADCRAGPPRSVVPADLASVYAGPVVGRAVLRSRHAQPARPHPAAGRPAEPDQRAFGLPLCRTLPVSRGALPRAAATG